MAYNSIANTMYEYCREYAFSYGSMEGIFLNLVLILIIAVMFIVLSNGSNLARSGNNERLVRVEKDVEDVKRTIENIKDKLDEI